MQSQHTRHESAEMEFHVNNEQAETSARTIKQRTVSDRPEVAIYQVTHRTSWLIWDIQDIGIFLRSAVKQPRYLRSFGLGPYIGNKTVPSYLERSLRELTLRNQ